MNDRLKELRRELWSEVQDVLGGDYVDYYLAEECLEKAYRKAIDDMFANIINITETMYKENEEKFYNLHQKKYKHYNSAIKDVCNELDKLKEELKGEGRS